MSAEGEHHLVSILLPHQPPQTFVERQMLVNMELKKLNVLFYPVICHL